MYCKEMAQKLLIEFMNLKKILINDGERNWIRGVLSIMKSSGFLSTLRELNQQVIVRMPVIHGG